LHAEKLKCEQEAEKEKAAQAKAKASVKAKAQLKDKLEAEQKEHQAEAALAKELADKGRSLREDDLSMDVQITLTNLKHKVSRGCSKRRYSFGGCLACEYQHLLKYELRKAWPAWAQQKNAQVLTPA